MTRRRQEQILVSLVAVAIALAALSSLRYYFRADITENHIHSISAVSVKLFSRIPDQVTITYYLSDRLNGMTPEVAQIKDLLYEYAARSGGKVQVSVVDPATAHLESQAQQDGIVPQQIRVVEQNQQSLVTVYSGILISYLDRTHTIPLVFDTATLEYDLTSSIQNLIDNRQPVLGIILGDTGESLSQNYKLLGNQLSRSFAVRQIQPGETIPSDVQVLFVIGGRDLDNFDLFPIDQYIMGGGKALFAVDGVQVDLQRNLNAQASGSLPVLSMLKGLGVTVGQQIVLDPHDLQIPIRRPQGNVVVQALQRYPMWIQILPQNVDAANPITAHFSGFDLYWASPLTLEKRSGLATAALASTSEGSWLMNAPFVTSPTNSQGLRKDASGNPGPFVVAATLQGSFDSYFAGKSIPTRAGVKRDWTKIIPRTDSSRIIVVGNSQFASDLVQYTNSGYNMEFLQNAAEWLANQKDLLSIRTRAIRDLRLDRIQNPAVRQFTVFMAEFLNIYLIPVAIILFGVARMYRRRQRALESVTDHEIPRGDA
ncbi:MAG TPA: GldG family protein [Spirochaetia bacterium]|nr:GldG family protein [Spirochaetia bacterium]